MDGGWSVIKNLKLKRKTKSLPFGLKDNFNYSTGFNNLNISAMEKLEQQILDLTITRSSWFLEIPHDLLIDIYSQEIPPNRLLGLVAYQRPGSPFSLCRLYRGSELM